MKRIFTLFFLFIFFFFNGLFGQQSIQQSIQWEIKYADVIISDANTTIELKAEADESPGKIKSTYTHVLVNGKLLELKWDGFTGIASYPVSSDDESLTVEIGNETFNHPINPIPLWVSVLPPLIAILLALFFREVITSLFIGVLSGALIIGYYTDGISGFFTGFLHVVDKYIMGALFNWSHIAVIFFSMTIGAVVSIISKNGGMRGGC